MDPPVLLSAPVRSRGSSLTARPLLCLVEGRHDVEFLRRLSANLSREDPALPDLGFLERDGRLVFVPFGGGDVLAWSDRFAPFDCPEFHLLDREILPETTIRRAAVLRVNARPRCRAFVTTKRSLENYLHPTALLNAGGVELKFNDEASVAECLARQQSEALNFDPPWNHLSRRTQSRLTNRAKRWLNMIAVEHLTRELLAESDPQGEVLHWLRTIYGLMEPARSRGLNPTSHTGVPHD